MRAAYFLVFLLLIVITRGAPTPKAVHSDPYKTQVNLVQAHGDHGKDGNDVAQGNVGRSIHTPSHHLIDNGTSP
ncbi:unnamed protein product [Caenorhabditis sp. 36 PRJEB53466]|nr:unnamed protein product [Caenorhabditis sp. 36 PRJEB53466]